MGQEVNRKHDEIVLDIYELNCVEPKEIEFLVQNWGNPHLLYDLCAQNSK